MNMQRQGEKTKGRRKCNDVETCITKNESKKDTLSVRKRRQEQKMKRKNRIDVGR